MKKWSDSTKPKGTLKGHKANGKYCMSCGEDRTIRLWNPEKQLLIKTYLSHGYEVYDVAISKDNSNFVSVGGDLHAFLWDVSSGRTIRKMWGHGGKIFSCSLNKESTVLVTGSYDKTASIWDLRTHTGQPLQTMNDAKDSVTFVKITDSNIYTCSLDGTLRDYDVRIGLLRSDRIGEPLVSLFPTFDEKGTLCASLDNTLRFISKEDGSVLQAYEGHQNSSCRIDCTMSYDHSAVLCGSEDNNIYVWEFGTGKLVAKLQGHIGITSGISYHPERHSFVSASVDGYINVWDAPA